MIFKAFHFDCAVGTFTSIVLVIAAQAGGAGRQSPTKMQKNWAKSEFFGADNELFW